MTAITMIQLSPAELQGIVASAVQAGIERAARSQGERIGIDGMAARLGVSRRTILMWTKLPGKLPGRRAGSQWLLADVMEWERQRQVPISAQESA